MTPVETSEALARQLWAIFDEAWPNAAAPTFDDLIAPERTAWKMLAQHIIEQMNGLIDVSLDIDRLMNQPDHK